MGETRQSQGSGAPTHSSHRATTPTFQPIRPSRPSRDSARPCGSPKALPFACTKPSLNLTLIDKSHNFRFYVKIQTLFFFLLSTNHQRTKVSLRQKSLKLYSLCFLQDHIHSSCLNNRCSSHSDHHYGAARCTALQPKAPSLLSGFPASGLLHL